MSVDEHCTTYKKYIAEPAEMLAHLMTLNPKVRREIINYMRALEAVIGFEGTEGKVLSLYRDNIARRWSTANAGVSNAKLAEFFKHNAHWGIDTAEQFCGMIKDCGMNHELRYTYHWALLRTIDLVLDAAWKREEQERRAAKQAE